jgi:PKD repeat protein
VQLTATNAYGSDTETKSGYITVSPQGQTMHVSAITVTRKSAGPNCSGQCYVTIVDGGGAPVANATVYTLATGPVGGNYSGLTDGSGVAFMETGKSKDCSGEWCFEVTDVTHATYVYNSGDNAVTKACESGPVYRATVTAPEGYALRQNRPNPFNPTTDISFNLPSGSHVTLEVYNITGQKVAVLADGQFSAGEHTVTWNASGVASGVYLYRLTTSEFTETKRMILLK